MSEFLVGALVGVLLGLGIFLMLILAYAANWRRRQIVRVSSRDLHMYRRLPSGQWVDNDTLQPITPEEIMRRAEW